MTATPLILAHRGLHRRATENTLEALEAARVAGCDGAEFDVRSLRDGTTVLHHDDDFRWEGQRRAVSTLTRDEIMRMRPSVPPLARVLEWAAAYPRFLLDVEFKDPHALPEGIRLLDAHPGPFVVTGFSLDLAAALQRQRPKWRVGWITDERRDDLAKVAAGVGLRLLVVHRRSARPSLLADAATRGVEVWAWGVDLRTHMRSLAARGLAAAISDRPAWLLGGRS